MPLELLSLSGGGALDVGSLIIGHIKDAEVHGLFEHYYVTKHVIMMLLASLILIALVGVAGAQRSIVPTGLRNFFEVIVVFLRDDIVRPNLGRDGDRYLHVLVSFFFFIFLCNFLGLVPDFLGTIFHLEGGTTATANLVVTAGLAVTAFSFYHVMGIFAQGPLTYVKNLVPGGLPLWIIPLMIVVEAIGHAVKPFALAVRLCANMTSGHIVMLVFMSLPLILGSAAWGALSVPVCVALNLLELFVCVLQAYVFTFLVTVFLGAAVHPEH